VSHTPLAQQHSVMRVERRTPQRVSALSRLKPRHILFSLYRERWTGTLRPQFKANCRHIATRSQYGAEGGSEVRMEYPPFGDWTFSGRSNCILSPCAHASITPMVRWSQKSSRLVLPHGARSYAAQYDVTQSGGKVRIE
jgi:hypothetical protein